MIDTKAAASHLAKADPVMARLIAEVGPITVRRAASNAFQALARSIIFQQLSGKAAGTIHDRFVALFADRVDEGFPSPADVLSAKDEQLRSAGLSRQKAAAVRSLAEHFVSGKLGPQTFEAPDDTEILERLTGVRGVGRWTAEMFLMFHLQRPDILPVNDVGINRAIRTRYGLAAGPAPDEVLRIGAPWRPWATVACLYLWRSEDTRLPAWD
jgi:3-methyladenine DNA glycosylase/8-oxoguanine DNA glycosylase